MLWLPRRFFVPVPVAQAENLAIASICRARDLVPGLHVGDQVNDTVAVSHLVVVPGGKASEGGGAACYMGLTRTQA